MNQKIRIGTRGSKLAMWQAQFVATALQERGHHTEIVQISTLGDRVQDRFLHEIGGKGVFIREIEKQLIEGTIDLGVHSLKDIPAQLPASLAIVAYACRHAVEDVLVLPEVPRRIPLLATDRLNVESLAALGAVTIATGSLRRQNLLSSASAQVTLEPIRGNVDTRLRKLEEHLEWDALILARAALERLQLPARQRMIPLDPAWFVPSPCQGILGLEMNVHNPWAAEVAAALNHRETARFAQVERQVLSLLGADCELPVGVHAYSCGTEIACDAVVLATAGRTARAKVTLASSQVENLPRLVVEALFDNGLKQVMQALGLPCPQLE
ncbi:MAG: hydroxymethylbilane synthase [Zetaproteobacteria bacterium]|nr:hydroxymethylbilane synthase [Zetaproteobacteria bacterium]